MCSSDLEKDSVQLDKRNVPDTYLTKWWTPKTTIEQGIAKVFGAMKQERGDSNG